MSAKGLEANVQAYNTAISACEKTANWQAVVRPSRWTKGAELLVDLPKSISLYCPFRRAPVVFRWFQMVL